MDLAHLGALPLTLGALLTMGGLVVSVIKGYRWFLDQITEIVSKALHEHEKNESGWQKEISRRLDVIEAKVDRLTERKEHRT